MRDILFKAKTKDGKRWVEGYYFAKPILDKHFIICDESQWEIDKDTICQYTGLTDKNGNKIWENDFVKTEKGLIYKIFWHKSFFRLSGSLQDENNHLGSRFWLNLWEINNIRCKEVIGNCFDNPELIGE